jgi:ribose transport system substrate-binding protein
MEMRRLLTVALLALAAALALAACGGGGSSSSSSETTSEGSAGTAAETTEAAKSETTSNEETGEEGTSGGMVEGPSEMPPPAIPAGLTPLPKAPPKGLNIVTLQCDLPTCKGYTDVFAEAAKALGWTNKTIVFKTGQPQDAMTQAVDTPGVEYINISGVAPSLIEPQLKQAGEKGIIVMKGEDPAPPQPPTVPVAISGEYGNAEKQAEGLMRWMINDSEGKADVAVIGLPELPIAAPTEETMEHVAAKECPGCKVEEVAVTGEELAAGTVPAKVVAYLQAHPEVNYVSGAFGNLTLGVPQALSTAGLAEKVKLVSQNGIEPAEAEALKKGELAAYMVSAQGEFATMWADAIARHAMGLPYPTKVYEDTPQSWLCTPETAEECLEYETFPPGTLEEFEKKIWKLG